MKKIQTSGFTLIELLIVISIIAILAGVVFVALNPQKRFQDARDAQRWSNISAILSAIKVDQVDRGGSYIPAIDVLTNDYYQIGTNTTGCDTGCTAQTTQPACVNLSDLVTQGYLGSIPYDPQNNANDQQTHYYLQKKTTGTIEIGACTSEGGGAISVSG